MADWARFSFKQATVVICACNLMVAVCISQCLLLSYYVPAMKLPLMYTRQADGFRYPSSNHSERAGAAGGSSRCDLDTTCGKSCFTNCESKPVKLFKCLTASLCLLHVTIRERFPGALGFLNFGFG
uniref:Uncharacterized protein n=1 Tax=Physcomitrium patens TaxID=3218 RepID=A0A2K1IMB7_PHYPA|nr:hypothetical protein PHYPA_026737 [Physcomitrium patens]